MTDELPIRAGPLEFHRAPACAVRKPRILFWSSFFG